MKGRCQPKDDTITDAQWIKSLKTADTPKKILRVIVENDQYFGYDPYTSHLREAMLKQAQRVLEKK